MTACRRSRTSRPFVALEVFSTIACAAAACSSERPPAGGGGSSTGGLLPGTNEEGTSDGSTSDGGGPNACNPIPNDAPPSTIEYTADPAPPPFVGGTIADGTYFLKRELHYDEPGLPTVTWPGITLTIAGADMKYGAITADKDYVPMAALLTVEPPPAAGDASNMLSIVQRCPLAGSTLGPQPYSVVGNEFTIGFGLYTVTYVKQ